MTLDILSEISDIPLLVSPQEGSSHTCQTLVLVVVPSKSGSATLLYTVLHLHQGEENL